MNRHLLWIVAVWAVLPLFGQEKKDEVTNAFLDLQRKGEFVSGHSQMQIAAGTEAVVRLLSEKPDCGYFLFAEDRFHDIVRTDSLPERWLERRASDRTVLNVQAAPGEFLTWQLGVYAPYQKLDDIKLSFSDFRKKGGKRIEAKEARCFNAGGVDVAGHVFSKRVNVDKNSIQALWMGLQIPDDAEGIYSGMVTLKPENAPKQTLAVNIEVKGEAVDNGGTDDGWRKSRLLWLDSRIGIADKPTAPYVAVDYQRGVISYLGGKIRLASDGFPESIVTNYDESNSLDRRVRNEILAEGIRMVIETDGGIEKLKTGKLRVTEQNDAQLTWKTELSNRNFVIKVNGTFGFDGFFHYNCEVKSLKDCKVKDIRLETAYTDYASVYCMGLGQRGGFRPRNGIDWKWNTDKHQDKIWMGNVNAGLNFTFMDERYVRPLVNVYYNLGKLNLPVSWGNENKGGIRISELDGKTRLMAYSGERSMKSGETLHYNFNMLITPVKPLDLHKQATNRFYHSNSDLSENYVGEAWKAGATAINVHHKKDIYPFINYPYYDASIQDLKAFARKVHERGMGMRLYYTTRELTVKVPELWALRSLNNEILHDGPGNDTRTLIHQNGPHEWLKNNLKEHYIPAWFNAFNEGKYKGEMDLSVITTPDSRWNNYYLEGLDWMIRNIGLDGIYIDDSALDRQTLQRARRILDADGKERLIDIHSWNHFNQWAGYANSLHIYLELLPYIDRTWIGEGFGADNTADFWLVEMSGIPFGLMSETLDAKNLMRGMAYGMLPRLPWSGNPVPMWKLWDEFGMKDAKMVGYWDSRNPIKCKSKEVKATLFCNNSKKQVMLVLSNWSKAEQTAEFDVDMDSMGWKNYTVRVPDIEGYQTCGGKASLKAESGAIVIIDYQ